jgi:ligand-binding SRPBCC domain-containing protein
MKTYCLTQEITIAAPVSEVWSFFSDPYNLGKISPGYMDFRIVQCPPTKELYDGMQIEYRVKPVLGIPLKWVTRINSVTTGTCFTDIQATGPYTLWEHKHTFEATEGGTRMRDKVVYALPFGVLGRLAHTLFVEKQLRDIFLYREGRIKELFPV